MRTNEILPDHSWKGSQTLDLRMCVAVQGPAVVVGTNVRQLRLDRLTPDKANQADPILGNKKNKNEKYGGVN